MTTVQHSYTSFAAYLALEAESDVKHEWIHGIVYAMSRRTPEHGRLSAAIVRALPQTEECQVYSSDTLLYVEKAEHEAVTNPSVVVEVLSKSTERRDKNERFVLFQQVESLEEYVLVSQDERRIEVRRRSGRDWTFDVKRSGETVRIHGADIAVDA